MIGHFGGQRQIDAGHSVQKIVLRTRLNHKNRWISPQIGMSSFAAPEYTLSEMVRSQLTAQGVTNPVFTLLTRTREENMFDITADQALQSG